MCDGEVQSSTLETDLKIEREWRQSLQETLVKDREAKAELQQQVKELSKQKEVSIPTCCFFIFSIARSLFAYLHLIVKFEL